VISRQIYVGNLANDVTEAHLRDLFAQFGPILEVKVYRKGSYGFVSFQEHAQAVSTLLPHDDSGLRLQFQAYLP
jgi:nucleolysin TIA-1/TIAR